MGESRFLISLRVFSDVGDFTQLINQIGLQPEWYQRLGEPRRTPNGKPLKGLYKSNYCCFSLEHGPDEGLVDSLNLLSDKMYIHAELFHAIRKNGGRVEFFVGWFLDRQDQGVFEIALLEKLFRLGVDLSLDVYCDSKIHLGSFSERPLA